MSAKNTNIAEAKASSFDVNAEIPDPTNTVAAPPGGAAVAGDTAPPTQGSGIKPYTKVGMINAIVQALGSMPKADVSAAYDSMHSVKEEVMSEDNDDIEVKMPKLQREDFDVSDDIKAIFEGSDVSEDFIAKAKDIFESAVIAKVNDSIDKLNEKFADAVTKEASEINEQLIENVDSYLDYTITEWMTNNKVAVDSGLKSEIVENFIGGLKTLFTEHYMEIPDDAVNVTEELIDRQAELEGNLNKEIEKNISLSNQIKEYEQAAVFTKVSDGLTESQKEKLVGLSQSIAFDDEQSYLNKIATLRESYFPTKKTAVALSEGVTLDEEPVGEEEVTKQQVPSEMAAYMGAITRSIKK